MLLLASEGASGATADAGPDAPLQTQVGSLEGHALGVRHATAVLDDGRTLELDGGVWLSTELAIARAKDLERIAAENAALRATPPPAPPLAMTLLIVVALGAGVAAGYLLPRP